MWTTVRGRKHGRERAWKGEEGKQEGSSRAIATPCRLSGRNPPKTLPASLKLDCSRHPLFLGALVRETKREDRPGGPKRVLYLDP